MNQTLQYIGNRYDIGLLWKNDEVKFTDSKQNALRRLYCMERKMDSDQNFATQYCLKIQDYVNKGYARQFEPEEIGVENKKVWYLPHFGVININKPGKLRLVFDAAAKTNDVSLNTEPQLNCYNDLIY